MKTDEILNSLEGIRRAAPPDFFRAKINARIMMRQEAPSSRRMATAGVALISVALFLLLVVNVLAIVRYKTRGTEKRNIKMEQFYEQHGLNEQSFIQI